MKTYVINGGKLLNGEVDISGSKNCALCLIAGALLAKEKVILENIPHIKDIEMFCKILKELNVEIEFKQDILFINSKNMVIKPLKMQEIKEFRASYYLIGSLLPRFSHLEIISSGGCNFVTRPINFHLDLFKYFGGNYYKQEDITIFDYQENNLDEYTLPYPSFGATVNALLFAISSNRHITINNICQEIEIIHFINFLKEIGSKITLINSKIIISPSNLKGTIFKNIPDRIETGTFLLMGPTICSSLRINNICVEHNKAILDLFTFLDINYITGKNYIEIKKTNIEKSCIIETGMNDKISSDLQPLLTVFCLSIPRISVIKETIYSSRFTHIEPLKKMGAFILESNQNILINGIMSLQGQEIKATDLRMAASMVFASLLAKGKSIIKNINFIDRGYEDIVLKINNLGGDIKVYEE